MNADAVLVQVGDTEDFHLAYGNIGPNPAYGVVLSGSLSGPCSFVGGSPFPRTIGTLGSMAGGVLDITVLAEAPGTCQLGATLSATNAASDSDADSFLMAASVPGLPHGRGVVAMINERFYLGSQVERWLGGLTSLLSQSTGDTLTYVQP